MKSKPVVVGIEDKQPSAVRFAAEAAKERGVGLRIVHCVEGLNKVGLPDDTVEFPDDLWPSPGQDLLDAAQEVIDSIESPPHTTFVLGANSPIETLLEEADDASLLVVGTDSLGRMERLIDGTVAEHLVKHAPVPVAVVPELSWPITAGSGVFLALDARALATGPIRFAFEEASRRATDLYVVHVPPVGMTEFETTSLRSEIAGILAGWPQQYPDVNLTRRFMHGEPDEGCLRASEEAELLVLGRDGDSGIGRLGHPVLTQIARRTHCPCVVVPDRWSGP
jgi:nucleotide-binding universal stress UspA family protein